MRLKIRRAFYALSVMNLMVFLVYLYGLASKVPNDTSVNVPMKRGPVVDRLGLPETESVKKTTAKFQFQNRSKTSDNCLDLKKPVNVVDVQVFQKVDNKDDLYVFSAFYDDIGDPMVRMLGLARTFGAPYLCQVWFDDPKGADLQEVTVHIERIPEDHDRRYGAVYLKCDVPKDRHPYAVSVVSRSCQTPSNFMPIMYSTNSKSHEFSVCVTPFNFKYSRAHELVEMIEFNKILGAGKVVFYNHSTGKNVDQVLNHYAAEGSVEVVQWHLPMKVDTWPHTVTPEIHYFGQLASLNDCLYRNLHSSKYIAYTDIDEFIVPKTASNWTSFIQKKLKNNPNVGAFIFRCNFFRKDWPTYKKSFSGKGEAEKYMSILLLNVLRESHSFNHFMRSKYIIVPSRVETVGIHNIWGLRPGYITDRVSADNALLHHYRNWENPNDGQERVEDTGVHVYKDKLLANLKKTWDKLPGVVMDIPLSNYSSPV